MSGRYAHFWKPAFGDQTPQRLVAVDVDLDSVPAVGNPHREWDVPREWFAWGWDTSHVGKVRWWEREGQTAAQFWQAVQWALARSGLTWAVSFGVPRIWGALGLWDWLDDGRLVLAGEDAHDRRDRGPEQRVPGVQRAGDSNRETRPGNSGGDGVLPAVRLGRFTPRRAAGAKGCAERAGECVLEDPPIKIRLRCPGRPGTLLLCDLRNWGVMEGPPPDTARGRAVWTGELMGRMVATLRSEGWGTLCATAGSQAAYTFRRRYLTHPPCVHLDGEALALEGAAYYGGRCEARRIGLLSGEWVYLDFRSLYPWVCATHALPIYQAEVGIGEPPSLTGRCGMDTLANCDVTLETGEPAYPRRQGDIVIYPVGRFRTTLCGPELDDAVARGRVKVWHKWATYQGAPALAAYVDGLWPVLCRARAAGDSGIEQWIKSLLVCLPGKFGQRGWHWQSVGMTDESRRWRRWKEAHDNGLSEWYRCIGPHMQREVRDDWGRDAIPAVSAWVTSAGRIRLLTAIRAAGWADVAYHDTDSLICTQAALGRLQRAGLVAVDALGSLRVLGRSHDCEVLGIKHYRIGDRVRRAGAPRGETVPCADGERFWYRPWLSQSLNHGQPPAPVRVLKTYKGSGGYRHGVVQPNGAVAPFTLWED